MRRFEFFETLKFLQLVEVFVLYFLDFHTTTTYRICLLFNMGNLFIC